MAGSAMTFTFGNGIGGMQVLTASWTSDDTTGAVTGTTPNLVGYVACMDTNPGATAPTDNYDIALNNSDGIDILGTAGANRDTATSERCYPLAPDLATVVMAPVSGPVDIAITNAGNSKIGTVKLFVQLP